MSETQDNTALRYSDAIPTEKDFSGDRFREVLMSHGITVMDIGGYRRVIRVDAHDGYPDIYIDVPAAGHNFDKYVFSEASGKFLKAYEKSGREVPQFPIERRLQYLNSILLGSGYVGERITLDMLDSKERLHLSPGDMTLLELELYKRNQRDRVFSDAYYFNNPEGREERLREMERRAHLSFALASVAQEEKVKGVPEQAVPSREPRMTMMNVKADEKIMITAVIGGRAVNYDISAQLRQKLMAVDDSHRLRMLDRIMPDAGIKGMTRQEKSAFLTAVNEQIFGRPSVFISEMSHTTAAEKPLSKPTVSAASMSAANYEQNIESQESQSLSAGIHR